MQLFNLEISTANVRTIIQHLSTVLSEDRKQLISVFTPNPEQIVQAKKNPDFFAVLESADLRIPDGVGLVKASQLFYALGLTTDVVRDRVTGRDLTVKLLQIASAHNYRTLVVGGRGYDALKPSERVAESLYKLQLSKPQMEVYWTPGYVDIHTPQKDEQAQLSAAIQKLKPDIVFVAFGAPLQEIWAHRHRQLLRQAGVRVVATIGGSFDVIFGKLKPAPDWTQEFGLEWLYRLLQEPWRWRRQLRLVSFCWLTVQELFRLWFRRNSK